MRDAAIGRESCMKKLSQTLLIEFVWEIADIQCSARSRSLHSDNQDLKENEREETRRPLLLLCGSRMLKIRWLVSIRICTVYLRTVFYRA